MSELLTRPAVEADLEAIAEIYNQGIDGRMATYETRHRSADDIRGWLGQRYPVLVVVENDRVIGFASTSTYRPRECYEGIAEFSVYVHERARGKGIGKIAMDALIEMATEAGFWKLVSRIFTNNTASLKLMASVGFREVGVYRRHAKLDDEWRDVVIVERLLGEALEPA